MHLPFCLLLSLVGGVVIVDNVEYRGKEVAKIREVKSSVCIKSMNIYQEFPLLPPCVICAMDYRQLRILSSLGISYLSPASQSVFREKISQIENSKATAARQSKMTVKITPIIINDDDKDGDGSQPQVLADGSELDEDYYSGKWIDLLS